VEERRDLQGAPDTVAEWLGRVQLEERRGELLAAYDLASRGLERHPGNPELAYRAVLALARSGATAEAERRYAELGLVGSADVEVAALAARIMKDRALASSGDQRRRFAAKAAEQYRRVAARGGGYFPVINAGTMSLVAGLTNDARALAFEALELITSSGATSYYSVATRAEAHLLLGDLEEAKLALEEAAGLVDDDYGAVSTTRRQLRAICDTTGDNPDWLSVLAGPVIAHYCGHIVFSMDGPGALRFDEVTTAEKMAAALLEHSIGFAYGSLAAGADILWAEALLAAGAELHVVLPCAVADFLDVSVAPSGARWVERFHSCLDAAVRISFATEGPLLGDESLFTYCSGIAMGLALLRARHLDSDALQLALWDGSVGTGPVGTAADVERWKQTGQKQVIVTPTGTSPGRGTAHQPSKRPHPQRVVKALLIGDMRGFSKLSDMQVLMFSTEVLGALAKVLASFGDAVEYRNTWGDALIAVFSDSLAASTCALELQEAIASLDMAALGLPESLAFRLSGHIGPMFSIHDPVRGFPTYAGNHISRAARIEPVTPPGAVYVTEAFAADLELSGGGELRCDYVGHMPTARDYGRLRMYRLRRRIANGPT